MEVELELVTSEQDEIQVMQKMIEVAKKAKEPAICRLHTTYSQVRYLRVLLF